MAGDARPPQPPPPITAATATWGTEHFDRAPTSEQLQRAQQPPPAQSAEQQQQQQAQHVPSSSSTPQPTPPSPPGPASVADAVKTIKAQDFLHVYQYPCARQGFLAGIGGGAAVGMLRYILGAPIPKAANWAVGAFALGGIVSFEVCQASRRAERAKMRRVVEVMNDKKQAELRRQEAAKARQAAEEQLRIQEQEAAERARRRWYKFW